MTERIPHSHTIVRLNAAGLLRGHLWLPTDDAFPLLRTLVRHGVLRACFVPRGIAGLDICRVCP